MPAQTQTRKILIKVDTADSKGLQEIANKMGALNKNTRSLADNVSKLSSAFQGWIAFLGVRELARMSDEVQNLSSRLKISAQAGEDTSETLRKISELADRTKQSIGATGEVYNRLAVSLSKVNPRSGELIDLTETLINTFRVAGATAGETTNTIVQLSQAFQSGELRGQELRSVMEQNGVLAKILNKEFGSDVYKKAEKGQIKVVDVLKLLSKEQKNIKEQSDQLSATFEQTLTQATNKVTLQIGLLNEQFGLSSKFATVLAFAIENLGNALAIGVPILVAWAATYIPKLIAGFKAMRVAAIAFAASNPILLALTAISVVAVLVYQNFDKLSILFKKLQANAFDFFADIEEATNKIRKALGGEDSTIYKRGVKNVADMRKAAADVRAEVKKLETEAAKTSEGTGAKTKDENLDSLIKKMEKLQKTTSGTKKAKDMLGELNKELLAGSITLQEYNDKLVNFEIVKLNKEFKEGKFDIFAYNTRLKELNLQELNRQLRLGVISFSQFRDSAKQANLDELNSKFEAGRITLTEYNTELVKISDKFLPGSALQAGTAAYLESIGTLSDNIAKGITATFGHLEDSLVEFVKTGELNFKKMTEAILEDLTRIIIRAAIIRPLAGAILNGFGGGAGGSDVGGAAPAAKGMAFDSNSVRKFASGGVVNSPTGFSYGGGRKGIMGEAGPEAIMPLQRASNGDLGVAASVTPVTVNIINQSNSQVEQRESTGANGEKTVTVLIMNRVREGIITGAFDGAMKQSFNINRKGS